MSDQNRSGAQNSTGRRPNFLVFVTDQFRYDLLGCTGHPVVSTPNLDALAADGVRFDRCYSVHPLCMATRAGWFTGLTPRGHGVRCNGIPLSRSVPTMPDALREAGYRTGGIGKMHLSPYVPDRVYDAATLKADDWPEAATIWANQRTTSLPLPYYGLETMEFTGGVGHQVYGDYARWLLAREPRARELMGPPPGMTMDFTKRLEVTWRNLLPDELHMTAWAAERAELFFRGAADDDRPFFLWLSVPEPHPPYTACEPWCDMYRPQDMPMPTRREGELADLPPHYRQLFETGLKTTGRFPCTDIPEDEHRRVYAMVCGMVSQYDAMVGRVLRALEDSQLAQDTVVAFMSDHGQMLGDHWMYGIPPCHMDGILRSPSIWRWPGVFQQGAVSGSLVSHLDFAPTVLDLADVPIPEGPSPARPDLPLLRPPWPGRSFAPLLTGEAQTTQDSVIAENDDDYLGLRMRTLITNDYHLTIYAGESYGELYDLRVDPQQLHNLWNDSGSQKTKCELQVQLMHRFAETDSALPRASQ